MAYSKVEEESKRKIRETASEALKILADDNFIQPTSLWSCWTSNAVMWACDI